ncbi:polysaccharide biosynthesis/export family protein [Defluviicoccus vanus]|uniref:Polysaccharide biosynthesis/export family protein n=1 Tax=Defluviicoccus vanus TaxID=111831 RepID=A0A7H1N368_9PROT|nr:polysaccharide biosynthesis/export family protein [Defluviicoccus vanus]QNT70154.1 polysaccharide biosynthesis/export family protein [Defluviicoccus vanus]
MAKFLIVAAILSLAAHSSLHAASAQDPEPYTLNAGDAIAVSVWHEEDLRRDLVVLPDGTVSFPLAGTLSVQGLTTSEVETLLAKRLEKYIPDAVVTVSVTGASGYRVYVIGEVTRPGEYVAPRRITVMQALSLAGGLTPYAGESSIRVLRHDNGRTASISFAYSEVKRGRDLDSDIELRSGDTVVVAGQTLF